MAQPADKNLKGRLKQLFELMFEAFGPQGWWPGDSEFEFMVGAVLTQNTAWTNVEKALANLHARRLMSSEKINRMTEERLAGLIKPAGFHNIKAKRLKNLVALVAEYGHGDPPRLFKTPPKKLRELLLSINGVGPETADAIMLYAAKKPFFVIDAYTRRMLERHLITKGNETYHQLQAMFMDNLPRSVKLYNEYHALIINLGKNFCRPKPKCSTCPLEALPRKIF